VLGMSEPREAGGFLVSRGLSSRLKKIDFAADSPAVGPGHHFQARSAGHVMIVLTGSSPSGSRSTHRSRPDARAPGTSTFSIGLHLDVVVALLEYDQQSSGRATAPTSHRAARQLPERSVRQWILTDCPRQQGRFTVVVAREALGARADLAALAIDSAKPGLCNVSRGAHR